MEVLRPPATNPLVTDGVRPMRCQFLPFSDQRRVLAWQPGEYPSCPVPGGSSPSVWHLLSQIQCAAVTNLPWLLQRHPWLLAQPHTKLGCTVPPTQHFTPVPSHLQILQNFCHNRLLLISPCIQIGSCPGMEGENGTFKSRHVYSVTWI